MAHRMRSVGRARRLVASSTSPALQDLACLLRLAVYRTSGRNLCRSPRLYLAGIRRQRRLSNRFPGMTTLSERAYFKWHAQEIFTGEGAAVDLGSWLGSTTVTLAMGLDANPAQAARRATLHAYDRFVWEPWMDWYADAVHLGPYSPGESFLPEFEHTITPWRDRIEVHEGDLREQMWCDGPIELLLVDAMKSHELAERIVLRFYGALTVGKGYIIHQDYGNGYTPWIHLVSYRFRHQLVAIQDVERSETMVFRVAAPLDDQLHAHNFDRASFNDAEVREAFEYSLRITSPEKHSGIHASNVMLWVHDGRLEEARALLRSLEDRRAISAFHLQGVTEALERVERGEAVMPWSSDVE